MTMTIPGRTQAIQPQGWSLARALAPLLSPWRRPELLDTGTLSDHWRRDIGLPACPREEGLLDWARQGRR